MLIDLHAHSNYSDGTDSPDAIVLKAKAEGITTLAITDHDTTSGWALASATAKDVGLDLVHGIELSVKNEGKSQHLLAYEPDPDHPALVELLRRALVVREARIPEMVRRIADTGVPITIHAVEQIAGAGVPGRPHIADALVELKVVTNRAEAFKEYLLPGCATYVARWSPPIEDALATITAAGGVPVIAHAWGKGAHVGAARFEQLRACGLKGIKVDHREHDESARRKLRGIARELELVITGSSDHHGTGRPHHELGSESTDPEQFERLRGLWAAPADRRVTSVVGR
jgi:predicted metal-dependent phosphoesterase TrpH